MESAPMPELAMAAKPKVSATNQPAKIVSQGVDVHYGDKQALFEQGLAAAEKAVALECVHAS